MDASASGKTAAKFFAQVVQDECVVAIPGNVIPAYQFSNEFSILKIVCGRFDQDDMRRVASAYKLDSATQSTGMVRSIDDTPRPKDMFSQVVSMGHNDWKETAFDHPLWYVNDVANTVSRGFCTTISHRLTYVKICLFPSFEMGWNIKLFVPPFSILKVSFLMLQFADFSRGSFNV